MKKVRYLIEAGFVKLGFGLLLVLGVKNASRFCAFLTRNLGPIFPVSKVARKQLEFFLPEVNAKQTLVNVWDHMGRIIAEFPHFYSMDDEKFLEHVELVGDKHLKKLQKEARGGIFISAHYGNWECMPRRIALAGLNMMVLYRPSNNETVDGIFQKTRSNVDLKYVPTEKRSMIKFAREVQNGGYAGMLVDQKQRKSLSVPFFGMPAPTMSIAADLAKKYNCPLIPMRNVRIGENKYQVEICKPIEPGNDSSKKIMEKLHGVMEGWIRERPDHWLWLHRRWGKISQLK